MTGYNCVLVPTHGSDDAPVGTSSSSSSVPMSAQALSRRSRLSLTHHERRGRARMSLAGYNEAAYYGAVAVVADNEDCSSTRDSSNLTPRGPEDASPWSVWRQWAADSVSEDGLSEGSVGDSYISWGREVSGAGWTSETERQLSRRQSNRRSARVSLAGYNCTGAISVTDEEGASSPADETGTRLSTIGEVLEMGFEWFGEGTSSAAARSTEESEEQEAAAQIFRLNADEAEVEPASSIYAHYDALEGGENAPSWQASLLGADETDDDLDMGLQDDPIAEA